MIDTTALLTCCGFDVQFRHAPEMLNEKYTHLVIVRHASDNFQEAIITATTGHPDDLDKIFSSLLSQIPSMLELYGIYFSYLGGLHDDPYVEVVSHQRQLAIMNQDFEAAAAFRDTERKLQRGTY